MRNFDLLCAHLILLCDPSCSLFLSRFIEKHIFVPLMQDFQSSWSGRAHERRAGQERTELADCSHQPARRTNQVGHSYQPPPGLPMEGRDRVPVPEPKGLPGRGERRRGPRGDLARWRRTPPPGRGNCPAPPAARHLPVRRGPTRVQGNR